MAHAHQHLNLGFAQVEQELDFRIIFIEPCDRSSSLFTRSLCGLAAPFYRFLSLSNLLSAKVVERPSSAIAPRRSGILVSLAMTVITYVRQRNHRFRSACCERSLFLYRTSFMARQGSQRE